MSTKKVSLNTNSSEIPNTYAKATQTISSGVLNLLESPLKDAKKQLIELELKQRELIRSLHEENLAISEVKHCQELQAMFVKMKLYHSKLQTTKRELKWLHERSQKLKKRALRLEEMKVKQLQEEIIVTKASSVIAAKSGSST